MIKLQISNSHSNLKLLIVETDGYIKQRKQIRLQ